MEVPEIFYKYRSSDGESAKYLQKQIAHDELYFAEPYTFNDPFDCNPYFSLSGNEKSILKYYSQALKKNVPSMNRAARRMESKKTAKTIRSNSDEDGSKERTKNYYYNKIQRGIGVYCLTTVPDNILMWSHYANNHKGVCLEYCGLNDFFANAQKVAYADKRPIINAFSGEDNLLMADKALLTKSSIWSYEEEWRMISYNLGPGIIVTPNDLLKKVIIGANATNETIDLVLSSIEIRKHRPEVVYAKVDGRDYRIKI